MIEAWLRTVSHPGRIDDLTAASYAAAAILCAWAWRRAGRARDSFGRWFWTLVGLSMLLSASNELLDFQTLLTVVVRASALSEGWYDQRRAVQLAFVMALAAAAATAAVVGWWQTRGRDRGVRIALVGVISVAVFALLRAASFHHVGRVLGEPVGDLRWASIAEYAGITAVAAGAAIFALQTHGRSRS